MASMTAAVMASTAAMAGGVTRRGGRAARYATTWVAPAAWPWAAPTARARGHGVPVAGASWLQRTTPWTTATACASGSGHRWLSAVGSSSAPGHDAAHAHPTQRPPPPPSPPPHDADDEAGTQKRQPPRRWEDEVVDYYAVLEVKRDATADEIKAAFRAQAKVYHPDVAKDDAAMEHFKLVNEAYSVLSDPELRKEYDMHGSPHMRAMSLRQRNEGAWSTGARDGLTAAEAFRAGMTRANERAKDSARVRATLARLNRTKLDVPTKTESLVRLVYPLAILGLTAFNFVYFYH